MVNICLSGGSKGADVIFGACAKKAGHQVRHFSFHGHHFACPASETVKLSELFLSEADPHIYLKRSYPTRSGYVNNLIRRNWEKIELPPFPHGLYTGIGSHDILPTQVEAINTLYNQI